MIPGALFALGMARERRWSYEQLGLFLGLSALGVGIGGQETYGQTIGLFREADTRAWGLFGLSVKGAVWGLLSGLLISLAWIRPKRPVTVSLVLLVATHIGWQFINHPKLLYFSNPLVRPREELWAGLLLAGLGLLALLRNACAIRLGLLGALGGAVGFGGGAFWNLVPVANFPGWKCMEFSFGFILGLALREGIPNEAPAEAATSRRVWLAYPALAAAVISLDLFLPIRFAFTAAVALLLPLLLRSPALGWPIGFGVTLCAACLDLYPKYPAWAIAFTTVPQALMYLRPQHSPWLLLGCCSFIYYLEYLR